jgi:hypothetical protein
MCLYSVNNLYLFSQTNTNNINKIWAFLQTTGVTSYSYVHGVYSYLIKTYLFVSIPKGELDKLLIISSCACCKHNAHPNTSSIIPEATLWSDFSNLIHVVDRAVILLTWF